MIYIVASGFMVFSVGSVCLFAHHFWTLKKSRQNARYMVEALKEDPQDQLIKSGGKKTLKQELLTFSSQKAVVFWGKRLRGLLATCGLGKDIDGETLSSFARVYSLQLDEVQQLRDSFLVAACFGGMLVGLIFASRGLASIPLSMGCLLGFAPFVEAKFFQYWARRHYGRFEDDIPEMMSMVVLAVQAGASFDTAFRSYGAHFSGPLAERVQQTYDLYISHVMTRSDALDNLARDVNADIFYRFISTVKRALYLGSPLALALESQLSDIRAYRVEKVKEEISKKPVQILLPLGLCILPAMLVLLIGPVLMEVMQGISMS